MYVDDQEFEVSVECPKKDRSITRHNYSTKRRTTTTKNYYIIQRPVQGSLQLEIFCHFCEKYYYLKIRSEDGQKKKFRFHLLLYGILMSSFWYSNLPIGIAKYLIWTYLLSKVYKSFKIPFIKASNKHKGRVVRKWKPTRIESNY